MTDLKELDKLEAYLMLKGIQYQRIDQPSLYDEEGIVMRMERHQICVPSIEPEFKLWDAICHEGSYGHEEGLLEIYGNLVSEKDNDSVVGYLTAYDVIRRIEKEKNNNDKE